MISRSTTRQCKGSYAFTLRALSHWQAGARSHYFSQFQISCPVIRGSRVYRCSSSGLLMLKANRSNLRQRRILSRHGHVQSYGFGYGTAQGKTAVYLMRSSLQVVYRYRWESRRACLPIANCATAPAQHRSNSSFTGDIAISMATNRSKSGTNNKFASPALKRHKATMLAAASPQVLDEVSDPSRTAVVCDRAAGQDTNGAKFGDEGDSSKVNLIDLGVCRLDVFVLQKKISHPSYWRARQSLHPSKFLRPRTELLNTILRRYPSLTV